MVAGKPTRYAFLAFEVMLLGATLALCVALGTSGEWSPVSLVALLLALALVGQWLGVEIRGGELGAAMVAIVLAMGLLGPVPAAACGVVGMIMTSALRRIDPAGWLANLSSFTAAPFAGAVAAAAITGGPHGANAHGLTASVTFGLGTYAGFLLALGLTFVLFALDLSTKQGSSFLRELRELVPLLPGELAAGVLAVVLAVAYLAAGLAVLLAAIIVMIIFQRLSVALVRSEQRAEQLLARSRQLVGLQLGVLRTLARALAMRDEQTARHAASVAFYAKALATELGCSPAEQDIAHAGKLSTT